MSAPAPETTAQEEDQTTGSIVCSAPKIEHRRSFVGEGTRRAHAEIPRVMWDKKGTSMIWSKERRRVSDPFSDNKESVRVWRRIRSIKPEHEQYKEKLFFWCWVLCRDYDELSISYLLKIAFCLSLGGLYLNLFMRSVSSTWFQSF